MQGFITFFEQKVLPHHAKNPNDIRLDGETSSGNIQYFGYFDYRGSTWKVGWDSYYIPLFIAYIAAKQDIDPFIERTTKNMRSLELNSEFSSLYKSKFKHLYIYEQ